LVAKDSNGFTIPRLYLGSHLWKPTMYV
jgi:hypothetical protein